MTSKVAHTMQRIEQGEFFLLCGPCAAESVDICMRVAEEVGKLAERHDLPYIFKSSYTKANRLSAGSYSGPGVNEGLKILQKVKEEFDLPIVTDVHETAEIAAAASVADVLQIPAFLCRQTELVRTAAGTGKWVNIKKGQFLPPEDMARLAAKATINGEPSKKVMLTERGSSFGYRNLVVDFRSLVIMREAGLPVVFDATHSLQIAGGGEGVSLGQPELVIPMARAAMAVGVDGLFVETHPNPAEAKSDAAAMLPLDQMANLLDQVAAIRAAVRV